MMTFTPLQYALAAIAFLGAIGSVTAQLTDLFGPMIAKDIASAASALSTIISAVMMPLTGQTAQIKNVAAMPGVEKITVNAMANQALAAVAMANDPVSAKVMASSEAAATVNQTAKGTTS